MQQMNDNNRRNDERMPEDEWEEEIPPRRMLHPSEKEKYPKLFYFSLTFLFLVLTVVLIIWGFHLIDG